MHVGVRYCCLQDEDAGASDSNVVFWSFVTA